jgi:hypothetical protein
VNAESQSLGEVPVWNTLGVIPGVALPEEFVLLSAHFDSWDTASGATDNGTGTLVMMEAMRILKAAYPNPRRTLIVGHWNGEEQGLNGSRAFARKYCTSSRMPSTKKSDVELLPRRIGVSRFPSPCAKPTPGMYRVTSAMLAIRWSAMSALDTTLTDCGTSRSGVVVRVADDTVGTS